MQFFMKTAISIPQNVGEKIIPHKLPDLEHLDGKIRCLYPYGYTVITIITIHKGYKALFHFHQGSSNVM